MYHKTKTNNPNFISKHKRYQVAKGILRKNKVGGIILADTKLQGYSNHSTMEFA